MDSLQRGERPKVPHGLDAAPGAVAVEYQDDRPDLGFERGKANRQSQENTVHKRTCSGVLQE
eukprot:10734565-Alexandrium_andersonii.AAC.1